MDEGQTPTLFEQVGSERLLFAWTVATGLCLLQTTLIATVIGVRGLGHSAAPFIATLLVAVSGLVLARHGSRAAFVTGTHVVAAVVGVALGGANHVPGMLVTSLAAGVMCVAAVVVVAPHLPSWLDSRVTPVRFPMWLAGAFAVFFVVQLARAGAHVHDPAMRLGAAVPTASAHSCLPAYLHAAELASSGVDNLYLTSHYAQGADTSVAGMAERMRDPFVYPPAALLVPAFALQLSHSFAVLNALWFALQTMMVFAVAFALAGRLVPSARAPAAWLVLPLVASLPMLTALQYGQVHVVTLCASIAAMIAFRKRWIAAGGALLGLAIVLKLFPVILLAYLAARSRWRAIASTGVACASYLTLTWLWFGTAPIEAFLDYQLPRLASGAAFATFVDQPNLDTVHMSIPGVAISLAQLGLDLGSGATTALGSLYAVSVLAVAWILGRRRETPIAWLALLGLASTAGLYAPAAYTAAGTLWLLAAILALTWKRTALPWIVAGAGVALQIAPFAGDWPLLRSLPAVAVFASLGCALLGLAVHLAPILLIPRKRSLSPFTPSPTSPSMATAT